MAIPKVNKQNILDALKYIDKNGVPVQNESTKYELVSEEGKKYPPKYVVAVAAHLATGNSISTSEYNAVEAKNFLKTQGFTIASKQENENKQEKFELTISAESITSTEGRFTLDDLGLGDQYKPVEAYFQKSDGTITKRILNKGEKRNSNQTLPRIACQVFEKQIAAISAEEKESFPICKYSLSDAMISGIYSSIDEYREHRNSLEYLIYDGENGRRFVFYCWNIFSTLYFVQECLKRFGNPGDRFVLVYCEKDEKEKEKEKREEQTQEFKGYRNPYSSTVIDSKNVIFHGAPGTGKSYLAKQIAADIISNGDFDDYSLLTEEQKEQVEFVQFHPNYDYSDFVEGIRPKINDDDETMSFILQDGIFKQFVERARKNYEDSLKTREAIEKEVSVQKAIQDFFSDIEMGVDTYKTITGNKFSITNVDEQHVYISIPGNASVNKLTLNMSEISQMLESTKEFNKIKDITDFFGKKYATQAYSYNFAIYKAIKDRKAVATKAETKKYGLRKYVFIIDEINRGEISKIFGELFFAIDPGYRGKGGEIATQYANMHPHEKFYVPDNVYLIGTMNDIDRSVDSFDFAMRRRFRFIELKANERQEMLSKLENEALEKEAKMRMTALNTEIASVEELNENYQIGASYFLKLKTVSFDQLWTDYLEPLLHEYVQGMYDEEGLMSRFAKAYGYQKPSAGETNEDSQS